MPRRWLCLCLSWWGLLTVAAAADPPANTPRKTPDVGYYATTQDVVDEILRLAKVGKNDVVCDLGCGDGRFVITAAKKYGCKGVGYEIDPHWVRTARALAEKEQVAELVEIREADIFTADLKNVTVVTLFLLPELNDRLIPQLEQLPRGARIISHEFEIPSLIPDHKLEFQSQQDRSEHLLYLYRVPIKRAAASPRKTPLGR
jgi:SAM-dependent methyltransferase